MKIETKVSIATLFVAIASFIAMLVLHSRSKSYDLELRELSSVLKLMYEQNEPRVDFHIKDNGVEFVNKDHESFDVYIFNIVKINTIGYLEAKRKVEVSIPFITLSNAYGDISYHDSFGSNEFFDFNEFTMRSVQITPFKDEVFEYISKRYALFSSEGYASPHLYKEHYFVELIYSDEQKNIRCKYLKRSHRHGGGGMPIEKITQEEFYTQLSQASHPNFKSAEQVVAYFAKRNFVPYE